MEVALKGQTIMDNKNEILQIQRKISDDPGYAYQPMIKGYPAIDPHTGTTHSRADGRNWRAANISLPTMVARRLIIANGGTLKCPTNPKSLLIISIKWQERCRF